MTRREIRTLLEEIQADIDEANADLPGLYEELKDVRERIAGTLADRAILRDRKREWKAKLKEVAV